jgi:putative peptide zinc metalloprotease protein
MLLKPAIAGWRFLLGSPQLNARRSRAVLAAGGLTLGLAVFLGAVPMPYSTLAEGVVWLPEQARVRPDTDGFIQQILVKDGQPVKRGQPLFVLTNPDLTARREEVDFRLSGLVSKLFDAMHRDPAKAQEVSHELERTRAELKQIDERLAGLLIRSPSDGMLAITRQQDLESIYVAKGTILANVLTPEEIGVRAVVTQDDAILLKQRTREVEVRLAENPSQVFSANLTGEIPAATSTLPSAALGDKGGGQLVTDPTDKDGLLTLQPVFIVDLHIPTTAVKRIGGRAWVRFSHGAEPLLFQWTFRFRQLFLKYLSREN